MAKFEAILKEYQTGKEVTRTRMYLEMMEEVMPGVDKYIIDSKGNQVQLMQFGETTEKTEKKEG